MIAGIETLATENAIFNSLNARVLSPLAKLRGGLLHSRIYLQVQRRAAAISIGLVMLIVAAGYLWLASVGRWFPLPQTTGYNDLLADAFVAGKVHLLIEPKAELLALDDPYSLEQREGIPYLWDSLLFAGKYFLYWGPVPAIATAGLKLIFVQEIGDQWLVLGFMLGSFAFSVRLILHLWKKHFAEIPAPLVVPGILVAGLANPLPWLLGRPEVYEVAIAAGQFFLVGGLYWGVSALTGDSRHPWRFLLSGLSLASAFGSRWNLAPAALVAGALLALAALRTGRSLKERNFIPLLLGLPMLATITILVIYNWLRFGSAWDLGSQYQLGLFDLGNISGGVFSIDHAIPNLYNYVMHSFRRIAVFPFIKPRWGVEYILPVIGRPSQSYYPEQVTGILWTSPFLFFSLYPLWSTIKAKIAKFEFNQTPVMDDAESDANRITLFLWLIVALLALPILFYLTPTMRYLADFIPAIVISALIGVWQFYRALDGRRWPRHALVLIAWGFAIYTSAIGMLLAVTGYAMRFELLNPSLFDRLARFFAW
jgi:hypothetical protein